MRVAASVDREQLSRPATATTRAVVCNENHSRNSRMNLIISKTSIIYFFILTFLISCEKKSNSDYVEGLNSCNVDSICESSYYFGELKNKNAVKYLLTGINDPRISHHTRYKGMSVYYCRAVALNKISGLNLTIKQHSNPDTLIINTFKDWAIMSKLISPSDSIKLNLGCQNMD